MRRKQLLSLMLFLAFVLTILPVTANAASSVPSGYTPIYTASDLDAVRNNLSGNYILMNDIDLSSWGDWMPIGYSVGSSYFPFSGIFDGNGKMIKNINSVLKSPNEYYMGLFGVIDHATIKNTSVTGELSSDGYQSFVAGGVAGYATDSTIENCVSYVDITYQNGVPDPNIIGGTQWGDGMCAGGIVGRSANVGTKTAISRCANFGNISGASGTTTLAVGGIVGYISSGTFSDDLGGTIISDCFSAGQLEAKTGYSYVSVGGIVGNASGQNSNIFNCYSADVLTYQYGGESASGKDVGGVVGYLDNYSTNRVAYSYYVSSSGATAPIGSAEWMSNQGYQLDIQTVGLKGVTEDAMEKQSSFSGFDFSSVWTMGSGDYPYPVLRGMNGADTAPDSASLCATHTYTSAGGNICTACGYVYEPALTACYKTLYVASDGAVVRDQPYAKAGTSVKVLYKGTPVKVTHYLINALGNKWYVTSDGYCIYSERLTNSEPNTYTITYKPNGSGVSNMPETQTQLSGTFKISTVQPARTGYQFMGWSTNANEQASTYAPGAGISVDNDLTLYAMWKRLSTASATVSPETKQKLDTTAGFPQRRDMCTTSATALMMLRKQIIDEKDADYAPFDFYDVRMSLGLSREDAISLAGTSAVWTQKKGFSNLFSGNGTMTFFTEGISVSEIGSNVEERKAKIEKLLDEHREGIVIYCKYSSSVHAILLTEYDYETDTFYACDSVDVKNGNPYPMELSETWLCRQTKSVDKIFENLINSGSAGCVWYISAASYE